MSWLRSCAMAYQSLYRKYRPQRFARAGRPGARDHRVAQRRARRPGRPRVPVQRTAGHGEDHHRAHPRQGAQLPEPRRRRRAVRRLRPLPVGGRRAPSSTSSSSTPRRTAASSDTRELLERIAFRSATGGKKVYILDEVHMLTDAASEHAAEEPGGAARPRGVRARDHRTRSRCSRRSGRAPSTSSSRCYSTEQLTDHLADICAREGVDADPEALAIVARAGAGSTRDSLSLLDQALAHATGRLDVDEVAALFGGSPFELRAKILQAIADGDAADRARRAGRAARRRARAPPGRRRPAPRRARRVPAARGRGSRPGRPAPRKSRRACAVLGDALGNAALVRVIETLGQAVVDMRGIDAADPRLVLEVALVRLARRDAGPPLALLAERVERLERAVGRVGPCRPRRLPLLRDRFRRPHRRPRRLPFLRRRRIPTRRRRPLPTRHPLPRPRWGRRPHSARSRTRGPRRRRLRSTPHRSPYPRRPLPHRQW